MCEGKRASYGVEGLDGECFLIEKSINNAHVSFNRIFLQIRQHVNLEFASGQCSDTHYGVCEGRRASYGVEEVDGECFSDREINKQCARFI